MREQNERLIRRLFEELWSGGDLDVADEIYTSDFTAHYAHPPEWGSGPEGVKNLVRSIRSAFRDYREQVEDMLVDGDRVAVRISITGTHVGNLGQLAPTGSQIKIDEIIIFRIRDGRVAEQWGVPDLLALHEQLGAISP